MQIVDSPLNTDLLESIFPLPIDLMENISPSSLIQWSQFSFSPLIPWNPFSMISPSVLLMTYFFFYFRLPRKPINSLSRLVPRCASHNIICCLILMKLTQICNAANLNGGDFPFQLRTQQWEAADNETTRAHSPLGTCLEDREGARIPAAASKPVPLDTLLVTADRL